VPSVRTALAAGLVIQVALLVALATTVGLTSAGWAAGVGYAIALTLLLTVAVPAPPGSGRRNRSPGGARFPDSGFDATDGTKQSGDEGRTGTSFAGTAATGTAATGPAATGPAFGGAAFGAANLVTLGRACLVGAVTALVTSVVTAAPPQTAPLPNPPWPASPWQVAPVAATVPAAAWSAGAVTVVLAAVALVLDLVDGRVARATNGVTAFGARFDMEVDAFLIAVLSILLARSIGPWVLAIGAMRYAFVAAGWVIGWLPGPLPPRPWRKVVAATAGVGLVVAAAGVLPHAVTVAGVAAVLALLVESFGRDIRYRFGQRFSSRDGSSSTEASRSSAGTSKLPVGSTSNARSPSRRGPT
jgi:phosphatidylglycerophosphate synthase